MSCWACFLNHNAYRYSNSVSALERLTESSRYRLIVQFDFLQIYAGPLLGNCWRSAAVKSLFYTDASKNPSAIFIRMDQKYSYLPISFLHRRWNHALYERQNYYCFWLFLLKNKANHCSKFLQYLRNSISHHFAALNRTIKYLVEYCEFQIKSDLFLRFFPWETCRFELISTPLLSSARIN